MDYVITSHYILNIYDMYLFSSQTNGGGSVTRSYSSWNYTSCVTEKMAAIIILKNICENQTKNRDPI